MITRLLIAGVGAVIVTASLLLGMDTVASLFQTQSGERYFRITDILPKPPPGRPERPTTIRAPQRVEPEVTNPDASLPVEAPTVTDPETPALEGPSIGPPEPGDRE